MSSGGVETKPLQANGSIKLSGVEGGWADANDAGQGQVFGRATGRNRRPASAMATAVGMPSLRIWPTKSTKIMALFCNQTRQHDATDDREDIEGRSSNQKSSITSTNGSDIMITNGCSNLRTSY